MITERKKKFWVAEILEEQETFAQEGTRTRKGGIDTGWKVQDRVRFTFIRE